MSMHGPDLALPVLVWTGPGTGVTYCFVCSDGITLCKSRVYIILISYVLSLEVWCAHMITKRNSRRRPLAVLLHAVVHSLKAAKAWLASTHGGLKTCSYNAVS